MRFSWNDSFGVAIDQLKTRNEESLFRGAHLRMVTVTKIDPSLDNLETSNILLYEFDRASDILRLRNDIPSKVPDLQQVCTY